MLTPGLAFADRTFDAILFDMDGTLISSIAAVDRAWAQWAGEHGLDAATFRISHGRPARDLVEDLVPPAQVEVALARINALELADSEGVLALPGALALLDALPAGSSAVVTSATRTLALNRLAAAGLPIPGVVVTSDDVTRGKPDPEPFALGAALLGVDAARCLVVEDAPAGLAAGRAAGCATLAVDGTHDLGELDADAHAAGVGQVEVVVLDDGTLRLVDRSSEV